MKHSMILKQEVLNGTDRLDDLQQSLDMIEHKLDAEVQAKQNTIERQEEEIKRLHLLIEAKDKIILETSEKLNECIRNNEGNRQLINKLLNDIARFDQDIAWYRKTYEDRSLLGVMRQKFFRRRESL